MGECRGLNNICMGECRGLNNICMKFEFRKVDWFFVTQIRLQFKSVRHYFQCPNAGSFSRISQAYGGGGGGVPYVTGSTHIS